ncbi:hypothetical protein [Streptomyces cyanogenus]|uniref:Uncharacterized protein n=1 Tax=Streptomyces cyanogenus TaxID=80860 RepID=A0ABX7U276_STRCY|nr:hypothetical protein [Streptomyces cyanogenus]QTE03143.1 hypothetical protein S1361_37755 [Streptomyces cyanogenus]
MESRPGDKAAPDLLVQRGDYRRPKHDGWLAQALADRSGHYADPAARMAAVGSLPVQVRTHAALLAVEPEGLPTGGREAEGPAPGGYEAPHRVSLLRRL